MSPHRVLTVRTCLGVRRVMLHRSGKLILPEDTSEIRAMSALAGNMSSLDQAIHWWRAYCKEPERVDYNRRWILEGPSMPAQGYAREAYRRREKRVYAEALRLHPSSEAYANAARSRLLRKVIAVINERCAHKLQRHIPRVSTALMTGNKRLPEDVRIERRKNRNGEWELHVVFSLNWWRTVGRTDRCVMRSKSRNKPAIVVFEQGVWSRVLQQGKCQRFTAKSVLTDSLLYLTEVDS